MLWSARPVPIGMVCGERALVRDQLVAVVISLTYCRCRAVVCCRLIVCMMDFFLLSWAEFFFSLGFCLYRLHTAAVLYRPGRQVYMIGEKNLIPKTTSHNPKNLWNKKPDFENEWTDTCTKQQYRTDEHTNTQLQTYIHIYTQACGVKWKRLQFQFIRWLSANVFNLWICIYMVSY